MAPESEKDLNPLEQAGQVLMRCRSIAVLGARDRPYQAGFYVPQYLWKQGYTVLPVNPGRVGQVLWGHPVVARLNALTQPVDMVNIFRRAETLPGHLEEILALSPTPAVVWLQLGIRNDAFAAQLESEGITVIQDRCTLADHRRLGLKALSSR